MSFDVTKYKFFKKIEELPFVDEIWLYGSRARGDERDRSDFDLAIISSTPLTNEQWFLVREIIEEADTLLKIDCVDFNELKNEEFKDNILRDKKVLFKR